jgi:hypothetical protein
MKTAWFVSLLYITVIASAARSSGDSSDQRYLRVSVQNNFIFIVKAADAANKPEDQLLDNETVFANKRSSTLCYMTICQASGISVVRMKEGGDTMALQGPMSIFKMPCAVRYIAFPYDSMKNQELLFYNSKHKLITTIDLSKLRDRLRMLPFFWTKTKPVGIDWDGLPHEIWLKNCFKCK